ncbi:hypothetical protein CDOO_01295 [Corynebacterium doosanense CAU 212 = DSM 45436]|uniref:Uncharacterized protein n=2 Tax=Corynebacterium TaxID=1716 RepID=A0A097ID77_9CORY|nr:hypothetical protein CDOO_01295 [Corynebacterium doosanense CAU 212 = DSM 45436]
MASMTFREQLTQDMPPQFTMPEEFLTLADWIEEQGYRYGNIGRIAAPDIHITSDPALFFGGNNEYNYVEESPERLYPVGYTGGEGSTFCLWLDDAGAQHVVHMGSGSGSVLNAVFPSAMSVLRLLAVGYFTPAFNDEWDAEPQYENWKSSKEESDEALAPYRTWLKEKWGQDTPDTGLAALGFTEDEAEGWLEEAPADDPFDAWLAENLD